MTIAHDPDQHGDAAGDPVSRPRRALVVRGGWDGHVPVEATDSFLPFLREHGFTIQVEDSPAAYADEAVMADVDLVVQSVTMSTATDAEVSGLRAAVARGAGLVGWHGGIADSYRASAEYLQLIGGQFVAHPGGAVEHTIAFTDLGRAHPVTAGLADFTLVTEQYWVLSDDLDDVLATTTHAARDQWARAVTVPAVWTRAWGDGRVVVVSPGHDLAVLDHPSVRTMIERGVLWAAAEHAESGR
ncbi:ThuA domain-containing protein [Curtobacterium sp. RRHDQ10]|uniref:ThuA domain-containing protein n=1 Tax=Curtobacterium phyllosphaerae TaxID=3413379 RepID=UPI003BF43F60